MKIPVKLITLEKEIDECTIHLDYLKKISVIDKELYEFVAEYKVSKKGLMDSNIRNLHCITTVAHLEISLILKSLHYSKQELEQRHILKNGILIIYETIKSINKFNKSLNQYSNQTDELKLKFDNYIKEIKKFKKEIDIDKRMKNIRNNTAGHINTDFIEYSRFIESVEIEKTMYYLVKFRLITNRLNEYLIDCMIVEQK